MHDLDMFANASMWSTRATADPREHTVHNRVDSVSIVNIIMMSGLYMSAFGFFICLLCTNDAWKPTCLRRGQELEQLEQLQAGPDTLGTNTTVTAEVTDSEDNNSPDSDKEQFAPESSVCARCHGPDCGGRGDGMSLA
jgi:cytochrome c553